MLESLFVNTDIEVVDTSILYYRGQRNAKTLVNEQFNGKLSDDKFSAPPDLLLVRNWNLDNKNHQVTYLAAFEIKSPCSKERVHGKEIQNYHVRVKREMNAHLSVHDKVILTDCHRWQFFQKPSRWLPLEKMTPEATIEFFKEADQNLQEPEEWKELQDTILGLVGLKRAAR